MIDNEILEPSVAYCWVDEDNARVSPRHNKLGEALSWIQRRPSHIRRIEIKERRHKEWLERLGERANEAHAQGQAQSIAEARLKTTLTGKDPVKLVRIMTRRTVEPVTEAEQAVVEQIMQEST